MNLESWNISGQRIGLVGASCRAMAASLAAEGMSVAVADMFADFDTGRIAETFPLRRYPWSAAAWLAGASVDAWSYTGGLENYPRLVARMAQIRPLLGNSGETLRFIRDPFRLADLAREHQFLFPEVARDVPASGDGSWLIKPLRSAGGLNIQRHAPSAFSPRHCYLQRWTEGVPMSLAVLSTPYRWQLIGACQLHVGSTWGAAGEFIFAGATTMPLGKLEVLAELESIVATLHQQAGLVGLWGIDFLLADRPILLEVNPRWTATMPLHERNLATRLMPRHVTACHEKGFAPLPDPGSMTSGLRILYATKPVIFTAEHLAQLSDQFDLSPKVSLGRPQLADIPNVGTCIESGHPICSLYADGTEYAEVHRRLTGQAQTVRRILQQDPRE